MSKTIEELKQSNKWITSNLTNIDKEILRRFRIVLENLIKERMLSTTHDADMASYRLLSVMKDRVNLDLYRKGLLSHFKHL